MMRIFTCRLSIMMIVISSEDFRRLSSNCQQEVLSLLSSKKQDAYHHEGQISHSHSYDDVDMPFIDDGWYESLHSSNHETELVKQAYFSFGKSVAAEPGSKEVVEISVEQARDLIANVSEKSQECLKKFASGQTVSLNELIGPEAPYRDFNELKRSLIGAVNRRLRTVTKNRAAVLFSSDRDKTRIRVTPLTAVALRQALGVPEPMHSSSCDQEQ